MRQVQIDRFGGPEELYVAQAPDPQPGPEQVVIRVETAGVNPLDYKVRDGSSGLSKRIDPEMFPIVLGRECCGVVQAVGEGADLEPGQRVFGMVSLADPQGRCYAEQVVMDAAAVAVAPDGWTPWCSAERRWRRTPRGRPCMGWAASRPGTTCWCTAPVAVSGN